MRTFLRTSLGIALVAGTAACSSSTAPGTGSVAVLQTSRAGDKFASKGALPVKTSATAGRTVVALSTALRQEIIGFGGALTEASATVLAALPPDVRKQAI